MNRTMGSIPLMLAAVSILVLGPGTASGDCDFAQPRRAKRAQYPLIPAFVSCNGSPIDELRQPSASNTPSLLSEGSLPGCVPQTYHERAGSPSNGWRWNKPGERGLTEGFVSFRSTKTVPIDIRNPPNDSSDVLIAMKFKGVVSDDEPGGVNASGTLAVIARATWDDRANGDMTLIDLPGNFSFSLTDGRGTLKTTADVLMNNIGQPGLPRCSLLEGMQTIIMDPNGNTFAGHGLFTRF